MLFLTAARVAIYLLCCVLSIPALYNLTFHTKLHRNFRAILIFMTISGYIITATTAITFIMEYRAQGQLSKNYDDAQSFFILLGISLYVIASFNMTLERFVAIRYVATYELLSTSTSSLIVTCASIVIPTILVSIIATFITSFVTLIVFMTCGVLGGMISLYLRSHMKHSVADINSGLQNRFQYNENRKTTPIYLAISLNELISVILAGVVYPFANDWDLIETSNDLPAQFVHLIGGYRVVFVQCAVLYYWHLEKKQAKTFKSKELHSEKVMDQHFQQMNDLWKKF